MHWVNDLYHQYAWIWTLNSLLSSFDAPPALFALYSSNWRISLAGVVWDFDHGVGWLKTPRVATNESAGVTPRENLENLNFPLPNYSVVLAKSMKFSFVYHSALRIMLMMPRNHNKALQMTGIYILWHFSGYWSTFLGWQNVWFSTK